ncbi:hypothetical protein GOP47_0016850 [Adiantum capillus-veneris]|uniref:Secreted protein n=1 Tax=Adiantum capillus-veneris TaxID=13818 RepID=A0A9D4UIK3_ADICA|nr:hypothetical protein GOP47_0016850 [Adiantum capillus-veneris]
MAWWALRMGQPCLFSSLSLITLAKPRSILMNSGSVFQGYFTNEVNKLFCWREKSISILFSCFAIYQEAGNQSRVCQEMGELLAKPSVLPLHCLILMWPSLLAKLIWVLPILSTSKAILLLAESRSCSSCRL